MGNKSLHQQHLKLKTQFVKQLRQEYHVKKRPIFDCFLMYMGFLRKLGCEFLAEMTDWQEQDYRTALENTKTMWHRNRRAGKTLGLTNIAVFFSIIQFGYRANKGKVLWRAPATDQLEQAQEWLRQNPFVLWITITNDVHVFNSRSIDMACLSAGKAASKGAAVLIEDEYRDVYKGLKVYDIAGRAEDMVAEGPNETRRMISASTGCRLTYFHNQFLSNEWVYCRHTWKECPWITADYVESKRKEHPEDPYFVDQEFNSIWVARGDTAYRNIYIVDTVERTVTHNTVVYKFGDHPFFPKDFEMPPAQKCGVDFNDAAGHYIVEGSETELAIFINAEYIVFTIPELKPYTYQRSMEIESGPFEINMENAKLCRQYGIRCLHQNWDATIIAERFRRSMDKPIVIDRRLASFTLGNFLEAVFDSNARDSRLKKTSSQHGLDAALHMIHDPTPQYLEDEEHIMIQQSSSRYIQGLFNNRRRSI